MNNAAKRGRTALLASIVDSSDDAIVGKTLEGIVTSWNRAAESMYGYAADEIIGKQISILFSPDHPQEMEEILAEIRKGKRVDHYETLRRRKDGALIHVSLTVSPINDASGRLIGASSIARDISERKRIDEQLQATSKYARSLIEASLDPLVTISPEGKITDVNEATVKVTGVPREGLIGTDFSNYFTEPERAREGYRQVFEKGFVTDYPLTIRNSDGRLVDVLYNASVYKDVRGNVQGVFAAARDVTESKRVMREFAETKNFLDNILESSTKYSIIGKDLNHRILSWNEGARRNYGYTAEEIMGKDSSILHAPEDIRSGAVDRMLEAAHEKGLSEGEFLRVRKDRAKTLFFSRIRNEAEEGLRRRILQFETLLNQAPLGVYLVDDDFRIAQVNPAALPVFGGIPDLIGRDFDEVIHLLWTNEIADELVRLFRHTLETGESYQEPERSVCRSDRRITEYYEWRIARILLPDGRYGVVCYFRDISERKEIEWRILRQSSVLDGINRIFRQVLSAETEEQLGRVCLAVAEEITGSRFGFICEINAEGRVETIAISDPGWEACRIPKESGHRVAPKGFGIRGIYGRVLLDGRSLYTNEPCSHPDSIGIPTVYPLLTAFLGVPLIRERKTTGMVAVGNRAGGYSNEQMEDLEALAPAIVQAFSSRRAEEALRESEERYRELVESSNSIIMRADKNLNITYMNEFGLKFFGYTAQELLGKNVVGTTIPEKDDRGRDLSAMAREIARQPDHFMTNVHQNMRKNGELVWVSWTNHVKQNADGSAQEILAIGNDISELKKTEEALEASEERYRHLVRYAPTGIYEVDYVNDRFKSVNEAMCRILGYTEEELLSLSPSRLLDEEGRRAFAERIRKSLAGQKVDDTVEYRVLTRDGREIWAILNIAFTYEEERATGALVVAHDITERKQVELELRRLFEKYVTLFNTTSDGVWIHNMRGEIVEVNDAYCRMSGYARDELTHMPISRLDADETPEQIADQIRRVIDRGGHDRFESRHRRKDGSIFDVDITALYLGKEGRGIAIFVRDITERKRMVEALRRSHDELELRVRERTAELERKNVELQDFAFIASHDLSEPLRKIQTIGSLLAARKADRLDDEGRDYISRMGGAANRMQQLLDGLLGYSRIETKGQEFRPTRLDDVARQVAGDLEVGIRKIGARVEVGPLPAVVGDQNQMRQLFQNLIANALKYHRSEVKPAIKIYAQENRGSCRLFVEDNGIGFDEKYLDKIFQPFQRLHGRNEYPGIGMGLAICRKIVERHHGTITARSTPGKGSTFIITLPLERSE